LDGTRLVSLHSADFKWLISPAGSGVNDPVVQWRKDNSRLASTVSHGYLGHYRMAATKHYGTTNRPVRLVFG